MVMGPAWMALMQGLTFPMPAILGGLMVILLGGFGVQLFPTFGFLVPLGFNEGPGQALSIGKVWEGVGFADAATIGLTFAAVGYFLAFIVGVPLVNRGIRSGRATLGPRQLPTDFLTGILNRWGTAESAGRLTIHSGNAETLAFQSALVGGVYGITYGIIHFLGGFCLWTWPGRRPDPDEADGAAQRCILAWLPRITASMMGAVLWTG